LHLPKNTNAAGVALVVTEWVAMRKLYSADNFASRALASMWRAELTALAWLVADRQGWQLFSTWLYGSVPQKGKQLGELILDDEEWAQYMRKAPGLSDQINNELLKLAVRIASTLKGETSGKNQGKVTLKFHGEVGGASGGYTTGYSLLHGTNDTVGGLGITGKYRAQRTGSTASSPCQVTFENLEYIWNDVMDHNTKYAPDVVFNDLFRMLAIILDEIDPGDYIVRIKWKPEAPVSLTADL
jgi:hypothetical protein